jgi:sister-chromatid-cohesion protein PDS5
LTRKLTGDLFQILKTVYLPEETSAWLLESSKTQKPAGTSKEKRREPREPKDSKSPPKRKASRHRTNGTTKRVKTARWNSDQSESEEEPSSDDSQQDDREETPTKSSSEREDGSSGQESDEKESSEKKVKQNRKPSRKAGTRAKRKISKQVKKGNHARKS